MPRKSTNGACGNVKVAAPSCRVVITISAIALTFTASKKALVQEEARKRGIRGFKAATKTKEGRKIPIVATIAPGMPAMIS